MQIIGEEGTVIEGDATLDALKASYRNPEARGAYFHSARSGLVATPSAAGPLWAFRWGHPTLVAVIDLLRVRAFFTTPPTAAQEWGIEARMAFYFTTPYNSNQTAYPIATAGPEALKKRTATPSSTITGITTTNPSGSIHIATTAVMTGGLFTQHNAPFTEDIAWELAAGAAVGRSKIRLEKDWTTGAGSPIILAQNEGILVNNIVLVGAAGVMRVAVEVAWHEVEPGKL